MMRLAGISLMLLLLTGCAKLAPAPLHYDSYCKGARVPSVAALRRIAGSVEDGTHYKSPSGPFSARPKQHLETYGGVVGTWNPTDFGVPATVADARKIGWEPFALAVPDDGAANGPHRIVFLAFRLIKNPKLEIWTPQASSDREDTCT
jgi:hypothetical protein